EKKSLLAGVHLSSLPHTPVAGPLTTDRECERRLLTAAAARVDHTAAKWLQLKVRDPRVGAELEGFSQVAWDPTFVLEVPAAPDELRFGNTRNHARIRWAVRKAD